MVITDHYQDILDRLGARRSGRGWDGCCPIAHRHRNQDRNPSLRLWIGSRGELVARCLSAGCRAGWAELVRALGTISSDWWPAPVTSDHRNGFRRRAVGKVVAVYDYRDAAGGLYAQKLRKEPGLNGARKSFSWRRPLPEEVRKQWDLPQGEPAWVWGLEAGLYIPFEGNCHDWRAYHGDASSPPPEAITLPHTSPSLYRLEHLAKAKPDEPVGIVEGEKKADLLAQVSGVWVSSPNGSRSWDYRWAGCFAGRKVVVIPDNNEAGKLHAAVVAGSILLAPAVGVKVIQPGPLFQVNEDEDIADYLARIPGKDRRKELSALLTRFPAFTRPPVPTTKPQPPEIDL